MPFRHVFRSLATISNLRPRCLKFLSTTDLRASFAPTSSLKTISPSTAPPTIGQVNISTNLEIKLLFRCVYYKFLISSLLNGEKIANAPTIYILFKISFSSFNPQLSPLQVLFCPSGHETTRKSHKTYHVFYLQLFVLKNLQNKY